MTEIQLLKLEEENKILKGEIHELVYQCERYKEGLKKAEDKYQRELEQNQKLIALIYQTDKQRNYQESGNSRKPMTQEMATHYKHEKSGLLESKPISLKREKGKIYIAESGEGFQSHLNSPKKNIAEKSSSTKSAINLLKYSDQTSEEQSDQLHD